MNSNFILILGFIMPIFGFSQMKTSIDAIGSLDYSYRSITTSSSDEFIKGLVERRNEGETGKVAWNAGLNLNRKLSKKIFLKTGVRFISTGYNGPVEEVTWGSQHDGNGGQIEDPSLPKEIQIKYNYWFIEIPLGIRWEINENKFAPFLEAGVAPSLYLRTRSALVSDQDKEISFSDDRVNKMNNIHAYGFISFGGNYTINEKYQLFAQPIFRYHLTKLADTPIREHLYSGGIELGIRRKIQ
ncbi:outer membrane beta-barrel protein [Portibacter lacus]|nr:outer membrane beta-barrel protein [Portibacter lacus]